MPARIRVGAVIRFPLDQNTSDRDRHRFFGDCSIADPQDCLLKRGNFSSPENNRIAHPQQLRGEVRIEPHQSDESLGRIIGAA